MGRRDLLLFRFETTKLLRLVPGGQCPVRFLQQFVGTDGADNRVNHPAAGSTKVAGDVAALLDDRAVDIGRGEIADLLMSGRKIFRKQLADARV